MNDIELSQVTPALTLGTNSASPVDTDKLPSKPTKSAVRSNSTREVPNDVFGSAEPSSPYTSTASPVSATTPYRGRHKVVPPMADRRPHDVVAPNHGSTRSDPYYWLRDRENPEVISYLEAENTYTDSVLAGTRELQKELVAEFEGRTPQDDTSVPYKMGQYYYYTRHQEGQDYPIYCRKHGSMSGSEEVILDVNKLAEGHSFFQVGGFTVSPDGKRLAFAADTQGRRIYTLHVKDLTTGEISSNDQIPKVTSNFEWASDSKTLFYARRDPETLRSSRFYRHELGTPSSDDPLIYEETDEQFYAYLSKSKAGDYIFVNSIRTETSEVQYLDAHSPKGTFKAVMPRKTGVKYNVEQQRTADGNRFIIRTNEGAKDYKIMSAEVGESDPSKWQEVVGPQEGIFIDSMTVMRDHLVLLELSKGLSQVRVRSWDGNRDEKIEFSEEVYDVHLGNNYEYDSDTLRLVYSSPITPTIEYDRNLVTGAEKILKQDRVKGYDPKNYETKREYARARDGAMVPITVVRKKGVAAETGNRDLVVYGYGSYAISIPPVFKPEILSLLDRGFSYSIAHVRGGGTLGQQWYDDGRLQKKKNTFTDFIDATEYLIDQGYGKKGHVYAMGESAGGLLMGAVSNMRPDLYNGIVADVPFVDIVTTMLDDSIPLTTGEYNEWGNPKNKEDYDYMLSYSPYDQVEAKPYSNMLITTGLHDSQVQYWEPAKWAAKLRWMINEYVKETGDTAAVEKVIALSTNMSAGHGGGSGRSNRYKKTAQIYAFLLMLQAATKKS